MNLLISLQKKKQQWVIFIVLNFVVSGVVASLVAFVTVNYTHSLTQMWNDIAPYSNAFYPVMGIWSVCLAYFFGFFGIPFVDRDSIPEPSVLGDEKDAHRQLSRFDTPPLSRPVHPVAKHPSRFHTPCVDIPDVHVPSGVESIDYSALSDDAVMEHLVSGVLKDNQLEKLLGDCNRAVSVRKALYERLLGKELKSIPNKHYDFSKVHGVNCEMVIGYVPVPVGVVGPLSINREPVFVPMATTEGCLVASTNRGCKAITLSGGCDAVVLKDAMTRAPCVRLSSAVQAAALKFWIAQPENYALIEEAFNSTTNYGRLQSVEGTVAGRNVYVRFSSTCGDAMGMNMVSKGCLKAVEVLRGAFPELELVAISGNTCTDKKPAAINWILGRGKSIVVEATLPESVVVNVLKSSVHDMIETNRQKNHIGSAMAGAVGGFNAHAANIVSAVFIATGQDPAQNIESSNCITIMELAADGRSLYASVTMPSIEVGTVGGGTHLPAQAGCLDICGVRGSASGPNSAPGDNARKLALIVGGTVLAGELSLIAALAGNHLVHSHLKLNRKPSVSAEAPM